MNLEWNGLDNSLKIGEDIVLLFGNWLNWLSKAPRVKQWTLFQIEINNGDLFSLLDLEVEKKEEKKTLQMEGKNLKQIIHEIQHGNLKCHMQIIVCGFGIRYYHKSIQVVTDFADMTKKD